MDAALYCTARRGEWVVVAMKNGIVVWHHGWRLVLSGLVHNFESCLTGQQSSGVQGRLRSSVQYVNYFYCYCIVLVRDAVVCKWKPIINLSLVYYIMRSGIKGAYDVYC